MSFFDGGIFLSTAPPRAAVGRDLGEYGSSGGSVGGSLLGSSGQPLPNNTTFGNYWARSNGVLFPSTLGNDVAINQTSSSYGAKLSVNGSIYAASGYYLSGDIYITKDDSNNLVFTDVISGSKTLAQLIAYGGGNVSVLGTPTNLQLAQWTDDHTIQGIDISSLTLTQSQITGLVTALAGKASLVHNLVDTTNHPVAGLTPGYVLTAFSPTTYGFASAAGVSPTDNILNWDVTNSWYAPYTVKAAGKFDSGVVAPTDVTRLNYGGYFYSTRFYGDIYTDHINEITGSHGVAIENIVVKDNLILSNSDIYLRGSDEVSSPYAYAGAVYLSSGAGSIAYNNLYFGDSNFDLTTFKIGTEGTLTDVNLLVITKGYGTITLQAGTGGIVMGGTDEFNNYIGIVNGLQPADGGVTHVVMYDTSTCRLYYGDAPEAGTGGFVGVEGTPAEHQVACFHDVNNIQGHANFIYDPDLGSDGTMTVPAIQGLEIFDDVFLLDITADILSFVSDGIYIGEAGSGSAVTLQPADSNGVGKSVGLFAGSGYKGNGGDLYLYGGDGTDDDGITNRNGGDLILKGGLPYLTGIYGQVYINSGLNQKVTNTATTPYAVTGQDINIYVDATAGVKVVNLPPATGSGRILIIKKVAGAIGNTVTVTADVTGTPDNIDGAATVVLSVLNTSLTIQDAVANNWYIN